MLIAEDQLVNILCNFKRIYPPAFFDIMIHLVIHLPAEAVLGGPVYMRWMYPFDRYMKKLKNYVQNKARPEGYIAEGYIAEEALTFYSYYLRNVPTKFNRPDRNDDGPPPTSELQVFRSACTPKSAGVGKKLDHEVKKKLVWYVLDNCPEIDQYKAYALFILTLMNSLNFMLTVLACFSQVFYLEDPSRSHHWKVVQEVNHQKIWDKDVIVDADVVHDSNSSDVALTANLDDLEYTRLSRPGPSTEVSFIPTSCVNDDDFIHDDVEYDVVHVLSSDSKDEDSD
ncbi:hypothetical protein Tco_0532888 [Tanacetum coccineum]